MPCVRRGGRGRAVRIVPDTNIVRSALLWRGTPFRLLDAMRQSEQVELFTCLTLLEELGEVLARPAPAKRLAAIGRTAQQVIGDYLDTIELVAPLTVPRIVPDDPDDDQVVAAAVAAEAALIVSGDSDLLDLRRHGTIRIVTSLLTAK